LIYVYLCSVQEIPTNKNQRSLLSSLRIYLSFLKFFSLIANSKLLETHIKNQEGKSVEDV